LGDWSADVAMTKKGFAEMAITGTMAGPVLNVLLGEGLGLTLHFATSDKPGTATDTFSIWSKDKSGNEIFNPTAMLPLCLLICQFLILFTILIGSLKYKFEIEFNVTIIQTATYLCVLTFLVVYAIKNAIQPPPS